MKNRFNITVLLFIVFSPFTSIIAQELDLKLNFDFFFDNTEFRKSSLTIDQSMSGINLAPKLGLKFDKNHSVYLGANLQKKLGAKKIDLSTNIIGYYKYDNKNTVFKAGIFEKNSLLENYDDLFFQDSIRYYRPLMSGLFLQKGDKDSYFNIWLDWTGLQSDTVREKFYLGASGKLKLNRTLSLEAESFIFHFANSLKRGIGVVDNGLVKAMIKYRYEGGKHYSNFLELKSGLVAGYEKDRDANELHIPIGFVAEFNAKYRKFGTTNRLYSGNKRMNFYSKYGNELYWGNPFYRSNFYLQNKVFWNAIESKNVLGQLASKIHFSEGKLFFEQVFILKVQI